MNGEGDKPSLLDYMDHSLSICQQVGEKLKNPQDVSFAISHGDESSIAEGWPGIALFYSVMDRHFPEAGWDRIAHEYLKLSIAELENSLLTPCSLLQGLSGLCFVAYHCSKEETRYEKLLQNLDTLFIDQLEEILKNTSVDCNGLESLNGILVYLILRQNHPRFLLYAKECLRIIIQNLSSPKIAFELRLEGWYEPPNSIEDGTRAEYPKGRFNLSMLHGAPGTLAALAIAACENIWTDGMEDLLMSLSRWLKKKQKKTAFGPAWHHSSSLEEEAGETEDSVSLFRDTWCYGLPCVARSLFLTAKALYDPELRQYSEELMVQVFSKPDKEWNLMGPSFASGRAGLMAITYRMHQETKNTVLFNKYRYLEEDLKRFYHPSHLFGFQSVDAISDEYRWVDDPSLICGAAGIALSLLLVQGRDDSKWDRIFLLI